jgi:hypothetical protein
MKISSICIDTFQKSVNDYHVHNDVNAEVKNSFEKDSLEFLFYEKNYVDTVQWHLEDIVRDPFINPTEGIELKRRIDKSNQVRTDFVEQIDDYFLALYSNIITSPSATLNTESPAWAIDRLSILILKIYHMKEETLRKDASVDHIAKCQLKLNILLEQQDDLSRSIDELLIDIESGKKKMKVYRQMKMYNDPALNPVLYNTKEK